MQNRLAGDVPVSGERYDLTLTSAGLDNRKREIVVLTIDNGPKKGVRISSYLSSPLKQALIEKAGIEPQETAALTLAEKHLNTVRLSARVIVERFRKTEQGIFLPVPDSYKETNVYVSYTVGVFGLPAADSQLERAFKRKETKFQRKAPETGTPEPTPRTKKLARPTTIPS